MRKFGLIGKDIEYSFSRNYFKIKFKTEDISDASYENFDLVSIDLFKKELKKNKAIEGFNVTIPYKESIIPYLDKLNKKAKAIGAVNTIKITKKGKYVGYNTDFYGFKNTLKPHLKTYHKKALILGTGGASKAVAYALKKLDIEFLFVSRTPKNKNEITYSDLNKTIIENHKIIINCTPLGTHPNIESYPDIPYQYLTNKHLLFDLIYNPSETKFLNLGKQKEAKIINGYDMLALQAEKSWQIWNK
ncbi:shikimate dehydrogenase [Lacinutrix sp. MedPE-SW]|uniref:shikimate dehydrogenase family protein n=1 Tax=Lacinutrix sp. MedPE-SW TaxID=1860087 RepID=UPI00090FAC87|nr:shikimate dehydrogenase [Lacinutrix sp. MedPE-SW]OIQ22808.1 MAG: shikimate dehydrogenase [Lacinutrix sp. MedPE-SW]